MFDGLTEDELTTFNRLRSTIEKKRNRNRMRTRLYDAHKNVEQFGITIPPPMKKFATVLGWPAKAVDTPARRIRPDGFSIRQGSDLFEEVQNALAQPRPMAVEKLAIQSSLKHSCAFVFTTGSDSDDGEVLLTAASALDASATVDPRTGNTLAALERFEGGWVLYLPGKTISIERRNGKNIVTHRTERGHDRVTCTVYSWGKTIDRPFGRSRITRPLIGYTDIGVRILLRQETHAEFFSTPQRFALGARPEDFTDESGRVVAAWEALIGGMLAMPDIPIEEEQQEKLRRVELGQFAQASMQPHSDHLKTIAMMVSSETSLPLNYLGIVQENPPSADAIRASEGDLVQIVEDELDWYRDSRANLARDVAAVLHGEWTPEMSKDLRGIRAEFRDPATPTKGAEGDWAIKMVSAFDWLKESEIMMRIIFGEHIARQMVEERRRNAGGGLLDRIIARDGATTTPLTLPLSESGSTR